MRSRIISLALPIVLVVGVAAAAIEDAGHIKVSKGAVQIERSGQRLAAPVGQTVREGDVVSLIPPVGGG